MFPCPGAPQGPAWSQVKKVKWQHSIKHDFDKYLNRRYLFAIKNFLSYTDTKQDPSGIPEHKSLFVFLFSY